MGFVVVARMAKTGDPIADVALVLFALYLGAILGRPLDRWISKRGPSRRAAHESATDAGALIAATTPRNDPIDQNPVLNSRFPHRGHLELVGLVADLGQSVHAAILDLGRAPSPT